MADLKPPPRTTEKVDSGAHELDSSDDHFSDASEGARRKKSPSIPTTRVERVDDKAAHGEEPGTSAYDMRTKDAVPDELEIIPEGSRSRSSSTAGGPSLDTSDVPKMVVDKVDPQTPSHGEVPNTPAWEMRRADAEPDVVRQAPHVARSGELSDEADANAEDDFDEFEVGDDEDDFGGFDEGEEAEGDDFGEPEAASSFIEDPTTKSLLPLNFADLEDADEIHAASKAHFTELFPDAELEGGLDPKSLGDINVAFLTERSQSLWAQLVAPPPLQPPDWVRSRIRRLFLVSLGVPVDLDEILPASKQKKLVLPSMDAESTGGSGENASVAKLKQKNGSSTSVASQASTKGERRRKGPAPPPAFDENGARLLCSTTDIALTGLNDEELQEHVKQVEELKAKAVQTLEYWLIQKDSAAGDKEAFEAVIENLVNHAKKIRK